MMPHIRELYPEAAPKDGRAGSGGSGMDVRRAPAARGRRVVWIGFGAAVIVGAALFFATLRPANLVVDRGLLAFGTVQQGPMILEAHGWGTLVPDRSQLVRAQEPGIVEAVYAVEGQTVRGGDRLIELSSSDIEISVEKAEQKFAATRGGMIALSREQSARRLALEASIADARLQLLAAENDLEELQTRAAGRVREIEIKRARERLAALGSMLAADEERLALITSSTEQQMAARRDELRWVESILDSERQRQRSLTLRAAGQGTVERLLVRPGSRVAGGEVLAEVTLSDRLKANVSVYASDGAEIAMGQAVRLEAAGGPLDGTVSGVEHDPGDGVFAVTIALGENPPTSATGSQDVEARVQLGTLEDVLYVDRPAYATAEGWTTVFRLAPDSTSAERVRVRLGRGSVDRIEVLSGLSAGDRIVVSDISGFDDTDCFDIQ